MEIQRGLRVLLPCGIWSNNSRNNLIKISFSLQHILYCWDGVPIIYPLHFLFGTHSSTELSQRYLSYWLTNSLVKCWVHVFWLISWWIVSYDDVQTADAVVQSAAHRPERDFLLHSSVLCKSAELNDEGVSNTCPLGVTLGAWGHFRTTRLQE